MRLFELSQPVEAYGYAYNNRDQRVMWRKNFASAEAAYAWADKKNATVLGTRNLNESSEESCPSCGSADVKTYSDGEKECNHCHHTWNVQGLNEFAPDGFSGGDEGEEFNPKMAKMAYDEGVVKGASLADAATLERAMAINDWDKHDGGIYSQHFAKGFIKGRMDKIRHNNKQYDLNLQLMKDGSIRHGEQGVAEGSMEQRIAQAKKNNPLKALVAKKTDGYTALVTDTITGKPSWFGGALWQTPELAMGHAKAFVKGFPHLEQEYAQRFIDKNRDGIVGQGVAEGSREQVDPSTVWEVSFDYGPHQSDKVKVRASSQEEAEQKGMRAAKKLGHRFPQLNWAMPAEQGVAESKSLSKRVRVVAGPDSGKTGWIREIKHGAFKGAPKTYYVDLDDGGQANNLPSTALRLVKEQSVSEMDKSQTPPGRDGGNQGGKEYTAKMTTADKMMKHAHDTMMKAMSDADKVKNGWRNPNVRGNYDDEAKPIRDDGNEGRPGKQRYPGKK